MITKSVKTYLLTISEITTRVGTHIYAGRIPKHQNPNFAIKLRRIATVRDYTLSLGEFEAAQPVVQIDVLTRQSGGDWICLEIADNIRKALNVFTKAPGTMGTDYVYGLQVERDAMLLPLNRADGTSDWVWQASLDVSITHQQAVSL